MANIKELIQSIESPDSSFDEKLAVINEMQDTLVAMKEHEQEAIDDNVELIIEALRTIEAKVEAKLRIIPEKGEQGLQGQKGEQGDRGLDGYQGKDGKSGVDGKDGLDGKDGVSVQDAKIDFDGSLVITLSDGREINVGEVVPVDVAQTIHKIQSGSGGDSQTTLDAIAALQATIATYGTMATQNANNVAITGGTINNTTVGATTPSTGVFTTLTAQTEVLKGTGQNFLTYSQTFQNAAWVKQTNVTATDNVTTAPDGSSTAASIAWGSASNGIGIYQAKTGLQLNGTTANTKSIYVRADVGGGTVILTDPAITVGTTTVTLTTSWQRVTLTDTGQTTAAGVWLQKTASSPSTIYVWGGQLELGSTANTYIPTTTTAVYGTPTLSFSGVASIGLQSDGSLYETSAGTGNVRFYTNNIAQEQARVSHTASAVNYHQLTGSATGSGPIHSVAGSDTNIDLNLTPKGTGTVVANGPFTATGQTSLGGVAGSDVFRVLKDNTFAGTTVSSFTAPQFSFIPPQSSFGAAVIGLGLNPRINSFGSDGQYFSTNQAAGFAGTLQVKIAHTASAVNYVQVTGAATGGFPIVKLSAQGSDSNVAMSYWSKGTFGHYFYNSSGYAHFVVNSTSSTAAVNNLQVTGAVTGFGPTLTAQGSDTNIPLVLQPKGTGALQAQQTDSTATGGNARGANAVDWQTTRASASQVASGGQSVLVGGQNNTVASSYCALVGGVGNTSNGFGSFLGSGNGNSISSSFGVIGGGNANTSTRDYASVLGGQSNTGTGYYNVIGGGFTNSGTANAAVTTQSGTMNATTAVTLSGSNANIKVGQLITGTSITSFTYVAAISGTSLTLSQAASGSSTSTLSFFTPHGVVVGGGNNQATGSYSFIGGGGDAGTAANRNVASGDWSTVSGGMKNTASGNHSSVSGGYGSTASGIASFIGGGGLYGEFSSGATAPNTASGGSSSIVGGWNNTATSGGSSVLGSVESQSNALYAAVVGGSYGTARAIIGNLVFPANNNPIGARGNSQAALLVLGVQTTDATATVLRSNTSAASTNNQVILPNNSAYFFTGEVVAGVTGGGNTKGWTIEGVIKRGANAASTALVGTPTVTSTYADAGASTWVIAVTADTTNGGLAVTFTGQASTTIRTVAQIRTTEMTY